MGMLDGARQRDLSRHHARQSADVGEFLAAAAREIARDGAAVDEPYAGTTDMYHVGEYMVWTDGTIKKCLRDTVYSPDEYAADWEDVD